MEYNNPSTFSKKNLTIEMKYPKSNHLMKNMKNRIINKV